MVLNPKSEIRNPELSIDIEYCMLNIASAGLLDPWVLGDHQAAEAASRASHHSIIVSPALFHGYIYIVNSK